MLCNPDVSTKYEIRRDIKIVRELFNLSQEELARILSVSVRTVQRIEEGGQFELNPRSRECFYSFAFNWLENFQKLKAMMRQEASLSKRKRWKKGRKRSTGASSRKKKPGRAKGKSLEERREESKRNGTLKAWRFTAFK